MRILLTGAAGTVGGAVRAEAARRGWQVIAWDRATHSPDDAAAIDAGVAQARPEAILHLAMGDPRWAARLAHLAAEAGSAFVFTSTASVFAAPGPHRIGDRRTATDDYGRYKIACEDAVAAASDSACTIRLGYQIDPAGGGNNLAAHLRAQAAAGTIRASADWIPATSMLADTAAVLCDLTAAPLPGLHHLDANAQEAWTYPQIVAAVADLLGEHWPVDITHDRVDDQRLLGSLPIPSLSQRLPLRR